MNKLFLLCVAVAGAVVFWGFEAPDAMSASGGKESGSFAKDVEKDLASLSPAAAAVEKDAKGGAKDAAKPADAQVEAHLKNLIEAPLPYAETGPAILGMQLGMKQSQLEAVADKYGGTISARTSAHAAAPDTKYPWNEAISYGLLPFPNLHDKTVYFTRDDRRGVTTIEFPKKILPEIVSMFDEGDTFAEKFAYRYNVDLKPRMINGEKVLVATDPEHRKWTVVLFPEAPGAKDDPKDVSKGIERVVLVAVPYQPQ